jgi:hypothetical protein
MNSASSCHDRVDPRFKTGEAIPYQGVRENGIGTRTRELAMDDNATYGWPLDDMLGVHQHAYVVCSFKERAKEISDEVAATDELAKERSEHTPLISTAVVPTTSR